MDKNNNTFLPEGITATRLQEFSRHIENNKAVFDLPSGEVSIFEGNTVYHIIPHYAQTGEDVVTKLRRILARELRQPGRKDS